MRKEDDNYLKDILRICIDFHKFHVAYEGYSTEIGKAAGYSYRSAIELYMIVSMRIYPDKKITKEDVLLLVENSIVL